MERIQVTVTFGEKSMTIEGPEDFVKSEVQRLTNQAAGDSVRPTDTGLAGAANAIATERGLVASKKPSGHAEMVLVLAYFLTKSGQTEFTPADVRRAYARAGARPPKVIGQALRDAKNINDYLEKGSARGTFRLSPHGERTVEFDLPRSEGV